MRAPLRQMAVCLRRAARALRDERGVAAIEFGVIAPVIILIILGVATYYVMGREDYRSKRGAYTAGDIVARQTSVTNAFLANVKAMAERISTPDARSIGFRVTSAVKTGPLWVVTWSYATAPFDKRNALDGLTLSAPDISTGESLIIVETSTPYRPMFAMFGNKAAQHVNVSYARPRTVTAILKLD